MKTLEVKHERQPEHDIPINRAWCDIGSHYVTEDWIINKFDVSVCEDCYEHYN